MILSCDDSSYLQNREGEILEVNISRHGCSWLEVGSGGEKCIFDLETLEDVQWIIDELTKVRDALSGEAQNVANTKEDDLVDHPLLREIFGEIEDCGNDALWTKVKLFQEIVQSKNEDVK